MCGNNGVLWCLWQEAFVVAFHLAVSQMCVQDLKDYGCCRASCGQLSAQVQVTGSDGQGGALREGMHKGRRVEAAATDSTEPDTRVRGEPTCFAPARPGICQALDNTKCIQGSRLIRKSQAEVWNVVM